MASSGRLRMRDLVHESGLSRDTIHFCIVEGLLPVPLEKKRTAAVYGREHLERLRRIRELREQHFLPLRVVKALINGQPERGFSAEQAGVLQRVYMQLGALSRQSRRVPLGRRRNAVGDDDLREMGVARIIVIRGRGTRATVREEDLAVIDAWLAVRRSGLSSERGFGPRPPVSAGHRDRGARGAGIFAAGYQAAPGEAARALEKLIPALDGLLMALLRRSVRGVLAEAAGVSTPPSANTKRRSEKSGEGIRGDGKLAGPYLESGKKSIHGAGSQVPDCPNLAPDTRHPGT